MVLNPNIIRYAVGAIIGALLAFAVCRSCQPDTVVRERIVRVRKTDTFWLLQPPQIVTRFVRVRPQTEADAATFGTPSPTDTVSGPFVAIDTAAFGRDTSITAFAWPQNLFRQELRRYTPLITVTDSTHEEHSEQRTTRNPIGIGFHAGYGVNRDGRMDWVVSVGVNVTLIPLGW